MLLIVAALVAGVLIGLALGGSLAKLADVHFRWWGLAILGLAVQLVPVPASPAGRAAGAALLVASYVLLLAFIALNWRHPGLPLMAVGFALNILVISVNGGMPVSDGALRSAYGTSGYRATLSELVHSGGAKHHLERPDDALVWLSDVIPVGTPIHRVFSPGDMVALVGMAWVMAAATKGSGAPVGSGVEGPVAAGSAGDRERRQDPTGQQHP